MNNMELTKNDTKMLQGLSVIAMVCLMPLKYYGYLVVEFLKSIALGIIPLKFYDVLRKKLNIVSDDN